MSTKRKPAERDAMPNLSERVEDLATQTMLGCADCEQWAALPEGIR